jgi:hypothetical protein
VTADSDDCVVFLGNGSTRCRECSRRLARERYPKRRAAIAETRRRRRETLKESAATEDCSAAIEHHRQTLKIRYWIKFGSPESENVHVGQDWIAVADMLSRAGHDREHLGVTWDIDFSRGLRMEDWQIFCY